jgi:hypothetical protein
MFVVSGRAVESTRTRSSGVFAGLNPSFGGPSPALGEAFASVSVLAVTLGLATSLIAPCGGVAAASPYSAALVALKGVASTSSSVLASFWARASSAPAASACEGPLTVAREALIALVCLGPFLGADLDEDLEEDVDADFETDLGEDFDDDVGEDFAEDFDEDLDEDGFLPAIGAPLRSEFEERRRQNVRPRRTEGRRVPHVARKTSIRLLRSVRACRRGRRCLPASARHGREDKRRRT